MVIERVGPGSGPSTFADAGSGVVDGPDAATVGGESAIREKSVKSLVHDSLEEAGIVASETLEANSQLASVDVESVEVEDLSTVVAERIKQKLKLKEDAQDDQRSMRGGNLQRILRGLATREVTASEDVLREFSDNYSDVSDRFLALEELQERLARERGNRDLKKAAKKAADTLWEEHKTAIIAGLNAAPVAERFARGDVEQFQALREAYRAQLKAEPTLSERFHELRERFGDDELDNRIGFLIAAAGQDLGAGVPSRDPEHLNAIVQELYRLQSFATTGARARDILARMKKRFGSSGDLAAWGLVEHLLALCTDKWVAVGKFEALSTQFARHDLEPAIYFLREVNALLHDVPEKFFEDADTRVRVVETSQAALDGAIQREEDGG